MGYPYLHSKHSGLAERWRAVAWLIALHADDAPIKAEVSLRQTAAAHLAAGNTEQAQEYEAAADMIADAVDTLPMAERLIALRQPGVAAHRLRVDEAEGEAYPADQPIGLPRSATPLLDRMDRMFSAGATTDQVVDALLETPPVEVGTPEAQALVAGLDAIGQALELPAPDKPDTLEPAA